MTNDQLAYSQQKNREHIWAQCKDIFFANHGEKPCNWKDEDQAILNTTYEALCKEANIAPW